MEVLSTELITTDLMLYSISYLLLPWCTRPIEIAEIVEEDLEMSIF